VLTVTNGFTNNGLIDLRQESLIGLFFSGSASLVVSNGILTNAAGASIRSLRLVGARPDQSSRSLDAQLDNQGTLLADASLSVNGSGRTFTNRGTIDIPLANKTLTVGAFSGDAYTQLAGMVTGAGTLSVTGLLTWSGGTMSGSGQTLANGGMDLNGSV